VGAHDGRIYQQVFEVWFGDAKLVQAFKDALLVPSREAFVGGVPAIVLTRQESPLCAGAGNPQHGFEEAATLSFFADVDILAGA
jgi:hypothetical protein